MKTLLLTALLLSSTFAQAKEPTLSCTTTTSWHHEDNFENLSAETNQWMVHSPNHKRTDVEIKDQAGIIGIGHAGIDATGKIVFMHLSAADGETGYGSSAYTDKDDVSLSFKFPTRNNSLGQKVNQFDMRCTLN